MSKRRNIGLGTQLRHVLELLDGDVESVYRRDHATYVPRFTPIMKALWSGEAKTIKDIAAIAGITHSAASQTVAKMLKLGFLESAAAADQRSHVVRLGPEGFQILPLLKRQWEATALAADELDGQLPYPLSQLLEEVVALLEEQPFAARIDNQAKQLETDQHV